MFCPRCRAPFESRFEGLFEDIVVRRCRACAVMWLSSDSLDRLDDNVSVRASAVEWREAATAPGLQCPECVPGYRGSAPLLAEVTLPSSPTVAAHRCVACRSFLLPETDLDAIRGFVAGRIG